MRVSLLIVFVFLNKVCQGPAGMQVPDSRGYLKGYVEGYRGVDRNEDASQKHGHENMLLPLLGIKWQVEGAVS